MNDEHLDGLALSFLEDYEKLQTLNAQLSESLRQGNLFLAQARYSGVPITPLQFPASMNATSVATVDEESHRWTRATREAVVADEEGPGTPAPEPSSSPTPSGVRQRRKGDSTGVGASPTSKEKDTSKEKGTSSSNKKEREDKERDQVKQKGKKKVTDPLRWFAMLPPLSLRQSQQAYSKGLDLVLDIAALRASLERQAEAYRTAKAAFVKSSSS